jgi:hypothetical protein
MPLLAEVIESRILLPVNLGIQWVAQNIHGTVQYLMASNTDHFSQLELIRCHKYLSVKPTSKLSNFHTRSKYLKDGVGIIFKKIFIFKIFFWY